MTLQSVAKIAGVSPSTVSRVINGSPNVLPDTAKTVRSAIKQLQFKPSPRGRRARRDDRSHDHHAVDTTRFLFLVVGDPGINQSPGFEALLRGVSLATQQQGMVMSIEFCPDPEAISIASHPHRPEGLLIHGKAPSFARCPELEAVPCVWLMANRERPTWGDQILPDNSAIGAIAASYLTDRGHRRLAMCSFDWCSWSVEVRGHAFARAAESRGATTTLWVNPRHGVQSAAQIAEEIAQASPLPTGLFIAEDRQVIPLVLELRKQGLTLGPDGIELISCNNEQPYLAGLEPTPATIDIRIETIGFRGVEMLMSRIQGNSPAERIRTLVDPILIEPGVSQLPS